MHIDHSLLMITDFTGRLHPALVHLPIGILVLGVCFELLTSAKRFSGVRQAIPAMILWGAISAIAASVTGLALESGGDYEEELVQPHEWSGIALAILSVLLYVLYRVRSRRPLIKLVSLLVLALVFLTGHLGGTITHGENFLSFDSKDEPAPVKMKPIPNIQEAMLYTDVVQPLLQSRCYSCHGARKQKGDLRLDGQEFILKGGESGRSVVPGKAEESELVERLLLPLDDEDRMPPKGKPQLTKEQVDILRWWVSTGADFHKKVKDVPQTEQVKPALLALQTGTSVASEDIGLVPDAAVEPADINIISKLNSAGVSVVPLAREINYLTASFLNNPAGSDTLFAELAKLKKQLLVLKIDGVLPGAAALQHVGTMTSLRKLQFSNAALSDESLKHLVNLKELRSLNLVGTSVTAKGLVQLKDLRQLKHLYLYKTGVTPAERDELKKYFPTTTFDFGNYSLPLLEGDTSEIKF